MSKWTHRQQSTPENVAEAISRIKKAHIEKSVSLSLNGLGLTQLPESIGRLTYLYDLQLQNNLLTELPESLGQLSQLEYLTLYENRLVGLPDSFGHLSQLRGLALSYNQLTKL